MRIIITEEQFKHLTREKIKPILYKFWDIQKRTGGQPDLDDIIYQISDVSKNSSQDYGIIRPLWYEYNGGYDVLIEKMKNELIDKQFTIEGEHNLKMTFKVLDIVSYDEDYYRAGEVEVKCQIINGTVDGTIYNQEEDQMETIPNMTIRDQYAELEYDSGDFTNFLTDETTTFLGKKLEKYGIPFDLEITNI
jgi:hypothetical protein